MAGKWRRRQPLSMRAAAGVVLMACVTLQTARAAEPDLVLSLDFETLNGRIFPDGSGQGNDAEALGGLRVKGVRGAGVDFSPPGASVVCLDSPSLNLTGDLTLEAWVAPGTQGTGHYGTIIRKDGAYALRFDGNRLGLLFWCGGTVTYLHTEPLALQPGVWKHVAGTWDGDRARLYVDGREAAVSPGPLPGAIDQSGAPCCIGSCRGELAFPGAIDEVRIRARALAPAEVLAACEAGQAALRDAAGVRIQPEPIAAGGAGPFRAPAREARAVVPGFVWVEAEEFSDYGGWVLDTQFVHLMGSAMLLAAGAGTPVADARTEIEVHEAGTYRVWVRTRNWIRGHSPGQFTVRLGDRSLPHVLGRADSDAWLWELAGECDLGPGKRVLALHDMTGYYGRCDAILLTRAPDYVPPAEGEALARERARLRGVPLEPADGGSFDVIVTGGGPAGCPAAIAAARLGARTALIHNRPVLGGNASDECGVPMNGAASSHPNARETGIAEEAALLRARQGHHGYSDAFRRLAEQEPLLRVILNHHVFAVEMADAQHIAAVKAVDTLTGQVSVYRARFFVDCTGDGWVGYYAGADFRLGREARSEFGEDFAPEQADTLTMSGCLMGNGLGFRARDTGTPVPFTRPAWAREIVRLEGPGRALRSLTTGEWWIEHPNDLDDLWQAETARDELIRIAFSYWDYVKNRSALREKAAPYALEHIPIIDAKRESRRLVGDYILTQNDCQSGRVFPDRIAYGGWPLDVHHPEGIFSGAAGSFWCNARVPIYTIPYRCLYSRNIENLLFAGRCASVTHIALGSVRVESTLATLGQAAGTAAALCAARGITPRALGRDHIAELQQILLRHDQTIPGIRNEDPADLARTARAITASSTAEFVEFARPAPPQDQAHPLDHDRGMLVPSALWARLESVSLYLGNSTPAAVRIPLHLRPAASAEDTSAREDTAVAEALVPPGAGSWVTFRLGAPVSSPYVWFWVPRTEGVSWRLSSRAPDGAARLYGNAAAGVWTPRPGESYAFGCEPPLRLAADFAPANVVDGHARRTDAGSSLWASDPRQPLPQWVCLEFERPVTVASAVLTFDTNLSARLPGPGVAPETVRDYVVSVRRGQTWEEAAVVRGNFQRRSTARFAPRETDAVRVTVTATWGDPSARIFEVRLYGE